MEHFYEIDNDQRKQYIDAEQIRRTWLEATQRALNYRGSMYWLKIKNNDYLYREYSKSERNSLGPRTPENEKIYAEFKAAKESVDLRHKNLTKAISIQERMNSALRVGRTPSVVVNVLEEIRKAGLQDNLMVIGTNALYAYEAHAGIRFFGDVTATTDMDLLWDSRKQIELLSFGPEQFNSDGLIGVLKKADSSFELDESKSSAANSSGYMIDLIKRRPQSLFDDKEQQQMTSNPEDFWASKIRNMDWLLSAPKFKQVVVATNGKMAEMVTVDPRAFALYKVHLSEKEDRDPNKAPRDLAQAQAVYSLIKEKLPHLGFERIDYLPERLRSEKVFDLLETTVPKSPTIAEQFNAVPAFDDHSGVIAAVSDSAVVQHIGRGRHVVWDRSRLHGAKPTVGQSFKITQEGLVESGPGKDSGVTR